MDLDDLPEVNYFRQIALDIVERATNHANMKRVDELQNFIYEQAMTIKKEKEARTRDEIDSIDKLHLEYSDK